MKRHSGFSALQPLFCACILLCVGSPAFALSFQYSGFASIIAGETFGRCATDVATSDYYTRYCTRYIADWAHAGVYTPDWSFKPESKVGLQGTLGLLSNLSATAQVVARDTVDPKVDLEWAFLTYDATPSLTFQVGRKRLPLYYYSTSQDVGYTYDWVRPPPDIYGWDAVNYNGGSAMYRTRVGSWSVKGEVFGGSERTNNSLYARLSYDAAKDVEWPAIRGGDIEVSQSWFTIRGTYIVSNYRQIDHATGVADTLASGQTTGRQTIYGVSANIDAGSWLVRSEFSVFDRGKFQYSSHAWMLAAGYRIGKFTPMLTASRYHEATHFPDAYTPAGWVTHSASLRYDLGSSSDLKIELDRFRDGHNIFAGSASVVALSYDVVF